LKRYLGLALGLICSSTFLFLAVRGVDLRATWHYMQAANAGWMIVIAFSTLGSEVVRTRRWHRLLSPIKDSPLLSLFRVVMIGQAGNQILPVRLGEPLRAFALKRVEDVPFATGLTTLVVERTFDVIGILLFLGLSLVVIPVPPHVDPSFKTAVEVLAGGVMILVCCGIFVLLKRTLVASWVENLLKILPKGLACRVAPMLHSLFDGLISMRSWRQVLALLAETIVLWICFGGAFAFGLLSMDLTISLDTNLILVAIVVLVSVGLFTMLPAAVGSLGTFQAGCIFGLAIFGIPKEQALGYSVLVHAIQFATTTMVGGYFFVTGAFRIADLRKVRERSIE